MARGKYQKTARQLRSDDEQVPETIPASHRLWVVALLALCLERGVGAYLGRWTAAGKLTIRFYQDDDASETFLLARDDPAKVCYAAAFDLFGEKVAAEWLRGVPGGPPERAAKA